MQSNKESNQKLIERFPFLMPRNRWTGEVPEDYDYSYTELDSMPAELDEMQRVDIGATSADTLPDVSGMAFQKGLSREDRITRFMQGAKNLYCYCVGGVGVKIEFAESGPSLQDTLGDFLIRAKSGL